MAQRQLDDKEHYEELTKKQAAIVDAYAENPNAGEQELSEIASSKLDDDTVSRSYIHPVLTRYPDIAEDRKLQMENQRQLGTETTEGDPFEGVLSRAEEWQPITEREVESNGFVVTLAAEEVKRMLQTGEIPDSVLDRLLGQTVDRAFE